MTSVAFHVDQLFSPAPGGIGTYVRNLVPALARRDPSLELTLFHARFAGAPPAEPWMRDLPTEELRAGIRGLYPRWNLSGRPPLPEPLRAADLVHAPSSVAVPPAAGGQRLVVTVHDLATMAVPALFPPKWRQVYRAGLRAAVRRADAIVTPSRFTAEDLLSRTKVDPARVHVIPEGAALPEAPAGPDPDRALSRLRVPTPYVLFVGTLEPRKNLVRLVRAYRRVAASGLPHALVLAGPLGWQRQALLRELALAGPGNVVLTGAVGPEELDALYHRADAFVYPALYEGFGLPVLEAMLRGVPTVCSNTTALPEVAGDAAVGVHPGSIPDIAAGIRSVLSDPELVGRLADRGRARAERFTWDEAARLTLQVYEKALGR